MTSYLEWDGEQWRDSVLDWVAERLSEHGGVIDGAAEQGRVRPWGTTFRIPVKWGTADRRSPDRPDVVWFKANGGDTRYETRLLELLGEWKVPGIVAPIAVDTERSWSLLPHAGEPLWGRATLSTWIDLLGEYGRIQVELADRVPDLLAAGVPDFRTGSIPDRVAELFDDTGQWLPADSPERGRAVEVMHAYRRWCTDLDGLGIAASLQHEDLHIGNVLADSDGRRSFIDWGDSCVGHPFGSLLVAMRVAIRQLGSELDESGLARLRDAYLEPWTEWHTRRDLLAAVPLALRVVRVSRLFSFRRAGIESISADSEQFAGWMADALARVVDPRLAEMSELGELVV